MQSFSSVCAFCKHNVGDIDAATPPPVQPLVDKRCEALWLALEDDGCGDRDYWKPREAPQPQMDMALKLAEQVEKMRLTARALEMAVAGSAGTGEDTAALARLAAQLTEELARYDHHFAKAFLL